MTHTGPSASASASGSDPRTSAPGATYPGCRLSTTLRRPGKGRNRSGSDSQVARPITTVAPRVRARKWARSSGRCQGSAPSRPMTPRSSWAQTRPIPGPVWPVSVTPSDRHRRLDRRVVAVPDHLQVLELVVEQRRRRPQLQRRERVRLTGELLTHLVDVVVVDVAVAAGPDQVAGPQADLLGNHAGEERV